LFRFRQIGVSLPVELLLQQVKPVLQLGSLVAVEAAEGNVGWGRRGQAAPWHLLVLLAATVLAPEAEDVGHARECAWRGRSYV